MAGFMALGLALIACVDMEKGCDRARTLAIIDQLRTAARAKARLSDDSDVDRDLLSLCQRLIAADNQVGADYMGR